MATLRRALAAPGRDKRDDAPAPPNAAADPGARLHITSPQQSAPPYTGQAPASVLQQNAPSASPVPLYFVGDLSEWWSYRKALILRCQRWKEERPQLQGELQHALAEIPRSLLPPPAFSPLLAAGTRWRPGVLSQQGSSQSLTSVPAVITIGGVFAGYDGPAGLFDYCASVLHDVPFLQLDGGHALEVSVPLLRAAMNWLLHTYPMVAGRIVLAGFSMGSATVTQIGAEFASDTKGLLIVAGQTSGTQGLKQLQGMPVLIVHGDHDRSVPVQCGHDLASTGRAAGCEVDFHVVSQAPYTGADDSEQMRKHHLWDERWDVQEVVLAWLRERLADSSRL
eukprot:TRINITY_DN71109_c0_g1_i1.p1 TRINITY_DN71109_c0_g1~~TRINITY_DN71109_c0_g1_i1.p1  ORF type:complete len:337 (+),score=38.15 TRINITY_DN71109_c0_g1_i1:94-1104(+)